MHEDDPIEYEETPTRCAECEDTFDEEDARTCTVCDCTLCPECAIKGVAESVLAESVEACAPCTVALDKLARERRNWRVGVSR